MLTVACVLSEGPTYNRSHVTRLEQMVAKHVSQTYQFVCVDDSPLPGWWAKIDLFKPGRFSGRVLYLDLDSTVIGSLDDLANYPSSFAIVKNFKEIKENNKAVFNSSVMAWDAGTADHLYNDFTPDTMSFMQGDQDWISARIPEAKTFHDDWCVSYKVRRYLKLASLPKDARVVCYHGEPKPWELPEEIWNS